jgi:hypothetical protein
LEIAKLIVPFETFISFIPIFYTVFILVVHFGIVWFAIQPIGIPAEVLAVA